MQTCRSEFHSDRGISNGIREKHSGPNEIRTYPLVSMTLFVFINPTASALDSRVSGPMPSGMCPLHENDVFRVALSVWHENRNRWRVFGRPRRRVSSTPTGMSYGYKYAIKTTPDLRF